MRPGSKKEDKVEKVALERKKVQKERDIFDTNIVNEQKAALKASIKEETEKEEQEHKKE